MSLNRTHAITVVGWIALVVASLSVRLTIAAGSLSRAEGLAWFAMGVLPLITLLLVFRGAAPPTIAQVLYDTEHSAHGGAVTSRDTSHASKQ